MRLTAILRVRSWSPVDLALVAGAVTLAAASGGRLAAALHTGVPPDARVPAASPVEPRLPVVAMPRDSALPPTPVEELAVTVSLAPFSVDRSPPTVRYRPDLAQRGGGSSAHGAKESRVPAFRLRGTATDGATRLALIEGAPSHQRPRLYRPSERVDEFVVKTVSADSAVLESADTTLVLRIARPWQGPTP